ncbi:hypothetical protein MHU86_21151 [Fragilaria crotonensis]|nr:hypothetical protein MHU86_21151 [Fragilaria crotonensis]
MSETHKKGSATAGQKGAVWNKRTRRASSSTLGSRVRQRTFPSETARRLMATMALDCGNPRALLKMTGGVVGHVDSLMPRSDFVECDSGDTTFRDNKVGGRRKTVEEADKSDESCTTVGGEDGDENEQTIDKQSKKKKRKVLMLLFYSFEAANGTYILEVYSKAGCCGV